MLSMKPKHDQGCTVQYKTILSPNLECVRLDLDRVTVCINNDIPTPHKIRFLALLAGP